MVEQCITAYQPRLPTRAKRGAVPHGRRPLARFGGGDRVPRQPVCPIVNKVGVLREARDLWSNASRDVNVHRRIVIEAVTAVRISVEVRTSCTAARKPLRPCLEKVCA